MDYNDPNAIWAGVVPCMVHQHMDEDCEGCTNEVSARGARLEQMQAEAGDRLNGIARQGGPQMPPSVIESARLEVLLDSLFTNPKDRLRYEGEVGRRVMLSIKHMQEQTKQPTLHVARGPLGKNGIPK